MNRSKVDASTAPSNSPPHFLLLLLLLLLLLHHHLLLLKVVKGVKAPEAPMLEEVNAHDVPVSRIDGALMNCL